MARAIILGMDNVRRFPSGDSDEQDLEGQPRAYFSWRNFKDHMGTVFNQFELETLLLQVGSSEEWTFLVVFTTDFEPGVAVQICGFHPDGVAVEAIDFQHSLAVHPHATRYEPHVDVGSHEWPYSCRPSELIDRAHVAPIVVSWLTERAIPDRFATTSIRLRPSGRAFESPGPHYDNWA